MSCSIFLIRIPHYNLFLIRILYVLWQEAPNFKTRLFNAQSLILCPWAYWRSDNSVVMLCVFMKSFCAYTRSFFSFLFFSLNTWPSSGSCFLLYVILLSYFTNMTSLYRTLAKLGRLLLVTMKSKEYYGGFALSLSLSLSLSLALSLSLSLCLSAFGLIFHSGLLKKTVVKLQRWGARSETSCLATVLAASGVGSYVHFA